MHRSDVLSTHSPPPKQPAPQMDHQPSNPATSTIGHLRARSMTNTQCHSQNSRCLDELSFGDHVCGIYDTYDELETVACAFLESGIRERQRVVCCLDTRMEGRILQHFRNVLLRKPKKPAAAAGINANSQSLDEDTTDSTRTPLDIDQLLRTRQLIFLHYEQTYLEDGEFEPDSMINLIRRTVSQAKSDGWRGVRTIGEMSWIIQTCTSIDKILRYENMLSNLYGKYDVLSMCQYDRGQFDPSILLNILSAHPTASIGIDLYDNFYFVPRDHLTNNIADHSGATLNHWIRNLIERKLVDREMIKAKEEAQAESRAKSMLLGTIFHDLKCPLIGIIGSIEMIRHFTQLQREQAQRRLTANDTSKSLDRDFEDCFKTMQVCGDHLLQVVNGILDFSRVRATSFDPTEFSLHTCLDDTFRVVESKALEKDIGISVVLDDASGQYSDVINSGGDTSPRLIARIVSSKAGPRKMILTDEGALRKVLINMLGNAVKFTNRGGNIEVSVSARPFGPLELAFVPTSTLLLLEQKFLSTPLFQSTSPASPTTHMIFLPDRPSPSRVLFQIKDNGIGISPKDISRIFEAFQRVDDARDSSGQIVEGTGLGLSIVRTLANMMGGDVSVESPGIGHGSVFSVWIPAYFREYDNGPSGTGDAAADLRLDDLQISTSSATTSTAVTTPLTPQEQLQPFDNFSCPPCTYPFQNSASIPTCQETPDIRTLKYLICDDNRINLQILTKFMNSYGCKDVTVCDNGQSAVDLVRETVNCEEEEYEGAPDDPDNGSDCSSNASTAANSTPLMDRHPPRDLKKREKLGNVSTHGNMDDDGERGERKPDDLEGEERKPPPIGEESSCENSHSSNLTSGSSCTLHSPSLSRLSSSSLEYVQTITKRGSRTRPKPFDVIFVDYRMPPGINGAQTSQLVRSMIRESGNVSSLSSVSSPCTPVCPPTRVRAVPVHQPVIVCLTAAAMEDESADCLANGIDETLLKPLKRDFLEKRLWDYARWLAARRRAFRQSDI